MHWAWAQQESLNFLCSSGVLKVAWAGTSDLATGDVTADEDFRYSQVGMLIVYPAARRCENDCAGRQCAMLAGIVKLRLPPVRTNSH
ncbi:hypothetical protein ACOMHN_067567 [Nucella lapillus]